MKYGISASFITSISLALDSGRSCNTEYSSCWLENNGLKPFFLRRNGYSWLKYIFSLVVLSPIRRVLTVTSSYFVQPRQRPWQIQLQRPSFLQQVQFHHRYAQTSNTTNSDKITTGSSVSPLPSWNQPFLLERHIWRVFKIVYLEVIQTLTLTILWFVAFRRVLHRLGSNGLYLSSPLCGM